jgi:hypothetical protein
MSEHKHIYLFTPSYTGKPDIENMHGMLGTLQDIAAKKWDVKLKYTVGDSLIPRARNMVLADAYANPEVTDVVMIDDDVRFEPGAVMRLLSHPVDLVMGAYPKRAEPLTYPIKRLGDEMPDVSTGLMKIRMGPAGFMRMTRDCIKRMIEAYPERVYYDENVPGGKAWALFMLELGASPVDEQNKYGIPEMWGEDFTFCKLWNDIGGTVWLDTLLTFQHIGRKAFEGCYAECLPGFVESLNLKSTAA